MSGDTESGNEPKILRFRSMTSVIGEKNPRPRSQTPDLQNKKSTKSFWLWCLIALCGTVALILTIIFVSKGSRGGASLENETIASTTKERHSQLQELSGVISETTSHSERTTQKSGEETTSLISIPRVKQFLLLSLSGVAISCCLFNSLLFPTASLEASHLEEPAKPRGGEAEPKPKLLGDEEPWFRPEFVRNGAYVFFGAFMCVEVVRRAYRWYKLSCYDFGKSLFGKQHVPLPLAVGDEVTFTSPHGGTEKGELIAGPILRPNVSWWIKISEVRSIWIEEENIRKREKKFENSAAPGSGTAPSRSDTIRPLRSSGLRDGSGALRHDTADEQDVSLPEEQGEPLPDVPELSEDLKGRRLTLSGLPEDLKTARLQKEVLSKAKEFQQKDVSGKVIHDLNLAIESRLLPKTRVFTPLPGCSWPEDLRPAILETANAKINSMKNRFDSTGKNNSDQEYFNMRRSFFAHPITKDDPQASEKAFNELCVAFLPFLDKSEQESVELYKKTVPLYAIFNAMSYVM